MKWICANCEKPAVQGERCPHCGKFSHYLVPTQEEIAQQCQLIQAGWSAKVRQAKAGCYCVVEAETTRCRHHQRGRRVMREREED